MYNSKIKSNNNLLCILSSGFSNIFQKHIGILTIKRMLFTQTHRHTVLHTTPIFSFHCFWHLFRNETKNKEVE